MRIEGYPAYPVRTAMTASPATEATSPRKSTLDRPVEVSELTPQERLGKLIEEKQSLADFGSDWPFPQGELGKHVDLRV